jgi:trk system potassium uptake protein
MKIAIAGAGAVGTFMAADLVSNGHEVTLFEKNPLVLAREAALLPQVRFVNIDACEVSSLEREHLEDIDVLVAATGDDEDNLAMSLLAKQEFAVPRVVARVNNPRNHWLFNRSWGIDVAVSTPHQLTAMVEEAVSVGTLVRLLTLGDGGAGLVEVTLAPNSPVVGKLISELDIPRDSTIVAIVRGGGVIVPRGDSRFVEGDEVVAMVTNEAESAITALLVGPSAR